MKVEEYTDSSKVHRETDYLGVGGIIGGIGCLQFTDQHLTPLIFLYDKK